MGGRYLVTGVQLGMLIGIPEQEDRQKLINEIIKKQFLGNSIKLIKKDCKKLLDDNPEIFKT